LIVVAAAVSSVSCVGIACKALRRYSHPFPAWMVDADQWYDDAIYAAFHAVIAGACVVYLCRTKGRDRRVAAGEPAARPTPWRDRVELRVVLYCLPAFFALQFPLSVLKAVRAINDLQPPREIILWAVFPTMGWISPPIAVLIVAYDRRRIRRESRQAAGECLNCGYDLRATPGRARNAGLSRKLEIQETI
jgi:hypothetical protein